MFDVLDSPEAQPVGAYEQFIYMQPITGETGAFAATATAAMGETNPFNYLDDLVPFEESELGLRFDEIVELAANQPDSEVFSQELRAMVASAKESGRIDASIYMAAVLGAMACLHSHMEALSTEASRGLFDDEPAGDERDHDAKKCDDCRQGRPCARK
jgi:hypothetical protein